MTEYNYFPLWDMDEGDHLESDDLSLSPEIIKIMEDWAKIYDQTLNWDDPISSGFSSFEDRQVFEQKGLEIWHQLQQALSPDYEVFYFSEIKHKLLSPADYLLTMMNEN